MSVTAVIKDVVVITGKKSAFNDLQPR